MKKTCKLVKIYFKELLYSLLGSSNKKSGAKSLTALFVIFAFVALALGYSLYNIAETLALFSMEKNVLIIGLFMAVFMSLMVTLNDAQGSMYKSNDYDLLASLPIKTTSIITAKYLSTYFVSILYFSIIAIPTYIVYFCFAKVTVLGIIFGVLSLFFIPAFSELISCLLGWFVTIITSRMKNKNIVRAIISTIFAVGLAVFISLANNNFFTNIFSGGFPLWFKIVFASIHFLFIAVSECSVAYFFASLAVSFAFVVLGVLVVSIGYKKINTSLMVTKVKTKSKPLTFGEVSVYKSMLKKEAATFFNSPVYCVNGLIGVIMTIVVTIITVMTSKTLVGVPEAVSIMASVEFFCMAMCTGIAPTTSVSISMEGTKFQQLKSLPVKFKDIAASKISLNLIIAIPVTVASAIVFCILVSAGPLVSIFGILYLICAIYSETVLGLILNLKFPRLNWSSETQAAKSGLSLFLTMFLNMLISILPMVLFIILSVSLQAVNFTLYLGLCAAFEFIVNVVLTTILCKIGEKLLKNIQV